MPTDFGLMGIVIPIHIWLKHLETDKKSNENFLFELNAFLGLVDTYKNYLGLIFGRNDDEGFYILDQTTFSLSFHEDHILYAHVGDSKDYTKNIKLAPHITPPHQWNFHL